MPVNLIAMFSFVDYEEIGGRVWDLALAKIAAFYRRDE